MLGSGPPKIQTGRIACRVKIVYDTRFYILFSKYVSAHTLTQTQTFGQESIVAPLTIKNFNTL